MSSRLITTIFAAAFSFGANADSAALRLECKGKISSFSDLKPMSEEDVHNFLVVVQPDMNYIRVFRDIESEETIFDVYDLPEITESRIRAIRPITSITINRYTGRFEITQKVFNLTAIYGGLCVKQKSSAVRKF